MIYFFSATHNTYRTSTYDVYLAGNWRGEQFYWPHTIYAVHMAQYNNYTWWNYSAPHCHWFRRIIACFGDIFERVKAKYSPTSWSARIFVSACVECRSTNRNSSFPTTTTSDWVQSEPEVRNPSTPTSFCWTRQTFRWSSLRTWLAARHNVERNELIGLSLCHISLYLSSVTRRAKSSDVLTSCKHLYSWNAICIAANTTISGLIRSGTSDIHYDIDMTVSDIIVRVRKRAFLNFAN